MRGAALRGLGVLTRGVREGFASQHRLNRAVHAVVAIDAGEMPLHHLRDGVLLSIVEPMQLGHRHIQQVAVDRVGRHGRVGVARQATATASSAASATDDRRW